MDEVLLPNDLDTQLYGAFFELRIPTDIRMSAIELLKPLKEMDEVHREHYEHSVRVGLLALRIGRYMELDQDALKALFFSGNFHDLGKEEITEELLGKTDPWTMKDYRKIQEHPIAGYNLIKEKFPFAAEIIVRHHTFQENGYPKKLPKYQHDYSDDTKAKIEKYARILAMADYYDALHRVNSKFGEKERLSDSKIYDQMIAHHPDRVELVQGLYSAGVFVNSEARVPQLAAL